MSDSDVQIRAVFGGELAGLIPVLSDLRMRVFAGYPYLYAGSPAGEAKYLKSFAQAPDAIVVTATDAAGAIVGCATGSGVSEHRQQFFAPLAAVGYDFASTFYFGESVLDSAWRGKGVGHAFFDAREAHAAALDYKHASFCAVIRPDDDPRRPAGYKPLDSFWQKRGYRRLVGVESVFYWPEAAGGPAIAHRMAYWICDL